MKSDNLGSVAIETQRNSVEKISFSRFSHQAPTWSLTKNMWGIRGFIEGKKTGSNTNKGCKE